MHRAMLGLPLAAALAVSTALVPQSLSAANPTNEVADPYCDRACLRDLLTQVLDAMAANDVSALPLAHDAKVTENGVQMHVYDGLWETASGVSKYRVDAIDPANRQIGVFVTMYEMGEPVLMSIRLGVDQEKITEIETIVARGGEGPFGNPGARMDEMTPRPQFSRTVPMSERMSRDELQRAADAYFVHLQGSKGGSAPFVETCLRRENGFQVTNGTPMANNTRGVDFVSMGCEEQQRLGLFRSVTSIRDRRYPVIDEETGVVFAQAYFDHTGTVQDITLTDGKRVERLLATPRTWHIAEMFQIDKGAIDQIEAVLNDVPYRMESDYWDRSAD